MAGCLKVGIMGGIVLFIWSFISWMVLPWHATTSQVFQSEVAVSQAITANAPVSGIYILPAVKGETAGPMVFASVNLGGAPSSMTMSLGVSLLAEIIAATLVAWLLMKTNKLNYLNKVAFVVAVAVVAILVKDLSAWNWMGFDTHYTLVMMADTLVGWFLAGLVMAKLTK